MENLEKTLQMVKNYLPSAGTELGCYTFLTPDALWTGRVETQCPFVVVAEESWTPPTFIIIVMADGPVYIAELSSEDTAKSDYRNDLNLGQDRLINYCAADFPKFMEIMKLYFEALENTPCPDVFDDEGFEKCAETEKLLRQQISKIDPTAIEDVDEGLWSTLIEELGYGM